MLPLDSENLGAAGANTTKKESQMKEPIQIPQVPLQRIFVSDERSRKSSQRNLNPNMDEIPTAPAITP